MRSLWSNIIFLKKYEISFGLFSSQLLKSIIWSRKILPPTKITFLWTWNYWLFIHDTTHLSQQEEKAEDDQRRKGFLLQSKQTQIVQIETPDQIVREQHEVERSLKEWDKRSQVSELIWQGREKIIREIR